jgi:hypothetical protein
MTFTARIIRGSPTWRLWTDHHRTGGLVGGVRFHWVAGGDFTAGDLAPHQIGVLQGLPDVRLEVIGMPLSFMKSPDAPAIDLPDHPVQKSEAVAVPPVQQNPAPVPLAPEQFHVKQQPSGMSTLRASEEALKRMKGPRR